MVTSQVVTLGVVATGVGRYFVTWPLVHVIGPCFSSKLLVLWGLIPVQCVHAPDYIKHTNFSPCFPCYLDPTIMAPTLGDLHVIVRIKILL